MIMLQFDNRDEALRAFAGDELTMALHKVHRNILRARTEVVDMTEYDTFSKALGIVNEALNEYPLALAALDTME